MKRCHRGGAWASVLALAVTIVWSSPVAATFPGANGKIAFDSNRDGDFEIYIMEPNGGSQTQLTDNSSSDTVPFWSPDGTKIVFTSGRDGNPETELYIMNADGSGQTRLTNNTDRNEFNVHWSPDGTKIAFQSVSLGADPLDPQDDVSEVHTMNADGSDQKRLTNNTNWERNMTWSPDSSRIAFTVRQPGDALVEDLYVADADGSNMTALTATTFNSDPEWSPDGTRIAFLRLSEGDSLDIYVMNLSSNAVTQLTDNPGSPSDFHVQWSPDGTKIAFRSSRDGNQEIYVMNSNGSNQTRLTNDPARDSRPRWSPNGKRILFWSDRDGDQEIYVMNADGANQTALTTNTAMDIFAEWQALDNIPPVTTIAGRPKARTPDRTPTFRFRANENGSRFECKLDSRPFRSCTSPKTYDRQSLGTHTFRVRATDAVGNTDPTPAKRTWRIVRP